LRCPNSKASIIGSSSFPKLAAWSFKIIVFLILEAIPKTVEDNSLFTV